MGCLELGETGAFQGSGSEAFLGVQRPRVKEKEVGVVKQDSWWRWKDCCRSFQFSLGLDEDLSMGGEVGLPAEEC